VTQRCAPQTGLAAVQTVWSQTVGEAIAAVAEPVAERDGVVTVRCRSATWAQELSLMESELLDRLRERLGEAAPSVLRCSAG
jgi:predicted nucleic acid-binding Zn ribbon protein